MSIITTGIFEDCEAALNDMNDATAVDAGDLAVYHWVQDHERTIRDTLLIVMKLMQEPSEAMLDSARDWGPHWQTRRIFEAMRDQLINEINAHNNEH